MASSPFDEDGELSAAFIDERRGVVNLVARSFLEEELHPTHLGPHHSSSSVLRLRSSLLQRLFFAHRAQVAIDPSASYRIGS